MLQTRSYGTVEITSVDREALVAELRSRAERLGREAPEVQQVDLFGSFARGDYTPESDVDLAVIVSESDLPFLERPDRYRGAFPRVPLDVNLTLCTTAEADRLRRDRSTWLSRISADVMRLYRRAG
jgi:hypothetical protein